MRFLIVFNCLISAQWRERTREAHKPCCHFLKQTCRFAANQLDWPNNDGLQHGEEHETHDNVSYNRFWEDVPQNLIRRLKFEHRGEYGDDDIDQPPPIKPGAVNEHSEWTLLVQPARANWFNQQAACHWASLGERNACVSWNFGVRTATVYAANSTELLLTVSTWYPRPPKTPYRRKGPLQP